MAYTITVYTTFKKESKNSTFTIEVPTEAQVNNIDAYVIIIL
jgi:hypothetical protein